MTLGRSSIPLESFLCLNPSLSRLEQDKITRQVRCSYENRPMRHTLLIRISSQAGRRGPEMMVRKGRKRGREAAREDEDGKGEGMMERDRQASW